jgi:hypothetical protein
VRHFTVEEANELIPLLTPVLADLRVIHRRMREAVQEIRGFEHRAAGNGQGENTAVFDPDKDVEKIQAEMEERLRYLQGVGVHLKDIENGILDFPTRLFDRDVYLCWRLGEDRVEFWHDVDARFAGRQPL